jgi:transcriptional regulator of acetoin/glycerol metabolism
MRSHLLGRMLRRGGDDRDRAREVVLRTAEKAKGDRREVCAELGISLPTLHRWCREYGIDLDRAAFDAMVSDD